MDCIKSGLIFTENSGNNQAADGALQSLKSIREDVAISVNDLDKNPNLLGVTNGVIELTDTGPKLRDAEPRDLITLNTGLAWTKEPNPDGVKLFNEYLDYFLPDINLRTCLQLFLGHCLRGGNYHKAILFLKGETHTGKTTLISGVIAAMGDYATVANSSIYQPHKLNPMLADALPKRLVVTSEFDSRTDFSSGRLKEITGGFNEVQVELKGSNVKVSRIPQFIPVFDTNAAPPIKDSDLALKERLYPIPFKHHMPKEKRIGDAPEQMKTIGREAVLAWLLDGYRLYIENNKKLIYDPAILAEADNIMSDFDEYGKFMSEALIIHPGFGNDFKLENKDWQDWLIRPIDLYSVVFRKWWTANGYQDSARPNQPFFSRRMAALGLVQRFVRNGPKGHTKYWFGVKISEQAAALSRLVD